MNKEKIITKKDVIAAIERADKYRKSFLSLYSFDPYDVITGGSGFPDASPAEVELYDANGAFLDSILKAMETRENAYNLNKNNTIYCTWKKEA